jgi:eukaryotic-like serine/threonine-protein kinase
VTTSRATAPQSAEASAQATDLKVGRYVVQAPIATGGMATVHLGKLLGTAGFSRDVAIKRLHPQFARDPEFVAMFLDEARLASRIGHPNVVPILDVVAESGELFLVMELIVGESLAKLARTCPAGLPLPVASSVVVGVLEGLHAAHEAHGEDGEPLTIVHRDVSPQNVLVGSDGVARLIDFGVAKAAGNANATRDGQIKGKVAYMAPEQLNAAPIDRRADLYSVGVLLWELLTGRRYFGLVETDTALVIRAMTTAAEPPSIHRAEVPAALDEVVLRSLEKNRDRRFSTAREMAQALELALPPAASRDVAEWVKGRAAESLAAQAKKLAEFDVSVATELPGKPALASLAEALAKPDSAVMTAPGIVAAGGARAEPVAVEGPQVPVAVVRDQDTRPAVLGGEGVGAPSSGLPPERSTRRWILPIAVVLATLVGFVVARSLPSAAPAPVPTAEPTVVRVLPPVPVEPATTTTAGLSSAPDVVVSASAPGPSAPPATAPSSVRAVPPTTNPPKVKRNCTPNYFYTSDGVKQFKPECLRGG